MWQKPHGNEDTSISLDFRWPEFRIVEIQAGVKELLRLSQPATVTLYFARGSRHNNATRKNLALCLVHYKWAPG